MCHSIHSMLADAEVSNLDLQVWVTRSNENVLRMIHELKSTDNGASIAVYT
jgi:hypothetical protein